jgi:hypothetical protein
LNAVNKKNRMLLFISKWLFFLPFSEKNGENLL